MTNTSSERTRLRRDSTASSQPTDEDSDSDLDDVPLNLSSPPSADPHTPLTEGRTQAIPFPKFAMPHLPLAGLALTPESSTDMDTPAMRSSHMPPLEPAAVAGQRVANGSMTHRGMLPRSSTLPCRSSEAVRAPGVPHFRPPRLYLASPASASPIGSPAAHSKPIIPHGITALSRLPGDTTTAHPPQHVDSPSVIPEPSLRATAAAASSEASSYASQDHPIHVALLSSAFSYTPPQAEQRSGQVDVAAAADTGVSANDAPAAGCSIAAPVGASHGSLVRSEVERRCGESLGVSAGQLRLFELREVPPGQDITPGCHTLGVWVSTSNFSLAALEDMVQANRQLVSATEKLSSTVEGQRVQCQETSGELLRLSVRTAELDGVLARERDQNRLLESEKEHLRDQLARCEEQRQQVARSLQALQHDFDELRTACAAGLPPAPASHLPTPSSSHQQSHQHSSPSSLPHSLSSNHHHQHSPSSTTSSPPFSLSSSHQSPQQQLSAAGSPEHTDERGNSSRQQPPHHQQPSRLSGHNQNSGQSAFLFPLLLASSPVSIGRVYDDRPQQQRVAGNSSSPRESLAGHSADSLKFDTAVAGGGDADSLTSSLPATPSITTGALVPLPSPRGHVSGPRPVRPSSPQSVPPARIVPGGIGGAATPAPHWRRNNNMGDEMLLQGVPPHGYAVLAGMLTQSSSPSISLNSQPSLPASEQGVEERRGSFEGFGHAGPLLSPEFAGSGGSTAESYDALREPAPPSHPRDEACHLDLAGVLASVAANSPEDASSLGSPGGVGDGSVGGGGGVGGSVVAASYGDWASIGSL